MTNKKPAEETKTGDTESSVSNVDSIIQQITYIGGPHAECGEECVDKSIYLYLREDLLKEVLECVGEDEQPPKDYNPNNRYKLTIADRNQLRAEIRQALKLKYGGNGDE